MKFADINLITDIPAAYKGTKDQKLKWLKRMACRIVDYVFNPASGEDVEKVIKSNGIFTDSEDKGHYPFCTCGEGIDCV